MRFKNKPQPSNGDTRIKTKFLLFPKKIKGETRWLEKTSWQEECLKYYSALWSDYVVRWDEVNWID